ncbi:MAG: DUF4287 domain-containing protein [bacterium]|nr:DUF4287 domain-containing protein [bacterium]
MADAKKKTPDDALATMIANLKEKTGRTLPEWVTLARGSGLAKHGQIVAMLKADHGLGHGYANLVAQSALQGDAPAPGGEDLVAAMYSGDKQALLPVWAALEKAVRGFGPDVDVSPKKTYVSLRRSKQFALVQPTTKTRVDVGLCLKGEATGPRLEAAGSFNAMVSHRVRLETPADVDAELVGWLRKAYDRA